MGHLYVLLDRKVSRALGRLALNPAPHSAPMSKFLRSSNPVGSETEVIPGFTVVVDFSSLPSHGLSHRMAFPCGVQEALPSSSAVGYHAVPECIPRGSVSQVPLSPGL